MTWSSYQENKIHRLELIHNQKQNEKLFVYEQMVHTLKYPMENQSKTMLNLKEPKKHYNILIPVYYQIHYEKLIHKSLCFE